MPARGLASCIASGIISEYEPRPRESGRAMNPGPDVLLVPTIQKPQGRRLTLLLVCLFVCCGARLGGPLRVRTFRAAGVPTRDSPNISGHFKVVESPATGPQAPARPPARGGAGSPRLRLRLLVGFLLLLSDGHWERPIGHARLDPSWRTCALESVHLRVGVCGNDCAWCTLNLVNRSRTKSEICSYYST